MRFFEKAKLTIVRNFYSSVNNFSEITCCFKKLTEENSKKVFDELIEMSFLMSTLTIC